VLKTLLEYIPQVGPSGPILFILLYVIATVSFVPGSLLTLGAGVLFGVVPGFFYVWTGATLGAMAAFGLGRSLARQWLAQKMAGHPRFMAIDRAVGSAGFQIVLLTRLSPVFPFNLLNYLYGLTQVSWRDYVLGSLGMIPGTLLYVYVGSWFGNLAALFAQSSQRPKTPLEMILYGVGLMMTLIVTLYVSQIARRALVERLSEDA
jgi:uncharacterized membrane protein YdjX (TVP38/TMEM64 family)